MGTNTLPTAVSGNIIPKEHHNGLKQAMETDWVPRNSSGVATENAGSLGTSSLPWLQMFFGAAASELSIREDSGKIAFYVGNAKVSEMDADGLIGSGIKDDSIARGKLNVSNYSLASGSGLISTNSTSFVLATNQSINITTIGRPVLLMVLTDQGGSNTSGVTFESSTTGRQGELQFRSGASTALSTPNAGIITTPQDYITPLSTIVTPSAGTHNYRLYYRVTGTLSTMYLTRIRLLALEL